MKRAVWLAIVLLAAQPVLAAPKTWQTQITAADRKRLARLWEAWTRSLADADAAGQGAAVTALGPAAVADAATMNRDASDPMTPKVAGTLPGVGAYRCRMITLGARAETMVPRTGARNVGARVENVAARGGAIVGATPFTPCRIEARGDGLWFEQDAGPAQRLGGRLYADGARQVFLGTTALAGEMGIMAYGADPQRNAVGALRAMGDGHWRLELPWPNWQSNLGIVEIVAGEAG